MVIISCITFSKYRLARNKTLMSQPFYRGCYNTHNHTRLPLGPKVLLRCSLDRPLAIFSMTLLLFLADAGGRSYSGGIMEMAMGSNSKGGLPFWYWDWSPSLLSGRLPAYQKYEKQMGFLFNHLTNLRDWGKGQRNTRNGLSIQNHYESHVILDHHCLKASSIRRGNHHWLRNSWIWPFENWDFPLRPDPLLDCSRFHPEAPL